MAYVGLDRGIINHWIYQDAEYFKVWFEMLYRARFSKEPHIEPIDGELITVNYSEFIYGRLKWSERLKVSEQRLRTLIKKLKQEKMIEVVSEHRKCTLYKIINYEKFNQQNNQQSDQQQQGNNEYSNQQSNQSSTSSQPAANQQLTTKEERKELNHLNHLKDISTIPTINRFHKENPFSLFETHKFGKLDGMSREIIGDTIDTYSEEWVIRAIKESVKSNVVVWNYVEKILKRWKITEHPEPWTLEKEEIQPQKQGNVRQFNRNGSSGKQPLPMIADVPKSAPLTPEKREEMRRKARLLDGKDTGTEDRR